MNTRTTLDDELHWYKDAIIYELHIKAFRDGNCDGIGDFEGLLEKLDYLQGLGITAIWVLPFYPSPLKDDGYELNEIVVLSPVKAASTASTTSDPWLRQILKPADGLAARPGQVLYSTIHAFKGLEAPAVVVTDLDEAITTDNFDSLLYVGLTRATDRLIALIEASTLRHAVGGSA